MQEEWDDSSRCQFQENPKQGAGHSWPVSHAKDWPIIPQNRTRQWIFCHSRPPQRILADRNRWMRSPQNSIHLEGQMLSIYTASLRSPIRRQIFSRCVAEALATVSARSNTSSYIDDNLLHAKTYGEYVLALKPVFAALRKFGLKLNPEKCTFLATEVKYLGRIVCSNEFKTDPKYVCAIREMELPTMKKAQQSLIGRLV